MTRIGTKRRKRNTDRRPRRSSRVAGPDADRRLRAAGLRGPGSERDDAPIDEIRNAIARTIAILINRWPGCREPLCRRHRGCMAPRIVCRNFGKRPMSEVARARATARIQRMLKAGDQRPAAAGDGNED